MHSVERVAEFTQAMIGALWPVELHRLLVGDAHGSTLLVRPLESMEANPEVVANLIRAATQVLNAGKAIGQ